MNHSLTIVIPAFNESGSIETVIDNIIQSFEDNSLNGYKIIIVDDGSTDETPVKADMLASKYNCISVIHHKKNRGYGGAIKSGYLQAESEFVTTIPADGEVNQNSLLSMLDYLEGADVVYSERVRPNSSYYLRNIITFSWELLMKLILGFNQKGMEGICIVRKKLIDNVSLISNTGLLHTEILMRCRQRNAIFVKGPDMPVYPRIDGESKVLNVRTMCKTTLEMIRLRIFLLKDLI